MKQLLQRVIATYHLGPMDAEETRAYIEHRLHTVGWRGDPTIDDAAYALIHEFTGGIPRKINTLCDRLFLMGYLEEIHHFGTSEVNSVIKDIRSEFELPPSEEDESQQEAEEIVKIMQEVAPPTDTVNTDERLAKMERSIISVLDMLKKIISSPAARPNSKE